MHKNTKLLPYQRREVYRRWKQGDKVTDLAKQYKVSRKTLYEVFKKAKMNIFGNYSSKNLKFRTLEYGLRKLSKTEKKLDKKLRKKNKRLRRYNKEYPGEMVHFDTSMLPLIPREAGTTPREYLFVAIDDYSRFIFADIFPDQTSWSSAIHLDECLVMLPFDIKLAYSDNGKEYKGAFKQSCIKYDIKQKFTKPYRPQTNGKAERVIQTIKKEFIRTRSFYSREQRRRQLYAFVRWYNQSRSHQALNGLSPLQFLEVFIIKSRTDLRVHFSKESVTNA
jgi:transposase InsO family protein